jgi:hypothetical protein
MAASFLLIFSPKFSWSIPFSSSWLTKKNKLAKERQKRTNSLFASYLFKESFSATSCRFVCQYMLQTQFITKIYYLPIYWTNIIILSTIHLGSQQGEGRSWPLLASAPCFLLSISPFSLLKDLTNTLPSWNIHIHYVTIHLQEFENCILLSKGEMYLLPITVYRSSEKKIHSNHLQFSMEWGHRSWLESITKI